MISTPLIAPGAVERHLEDAVVLDARTGPDAATAHAEGHLRGAILVDLETELSAPDDPAKGGRHPLPPLEDWLAQVGAWGITPNTPVVIYDAASGGMAAARAWWMLRAVGHRAATVVDGGWPALVAAGAPVDAEPPRIVAAPPYPSLVRAWPSADAELVERAANDPRWALIDARAPERFRGENEPLDPVAGHIPGAVNLFWKTLVGPDGKLAPRGELLKRFDAARQGAPAKRVICYCGSGVTACHLLLGMEACGLHGARLYVGSWSEWCRSHER